MSADLGNRFCLNSAAHTKHLWFPTPFDSKFGDLYYTCPGYESNNNGKH